MKRSLSFTATDRFHLWRTGSFIGQVFTTHAHERARVSVRVVPVLSIAANTFRIWYVVGRERRPTEEECENRLTRPDWKWKCGYFHPRFRTLIEIRVTTGRPCHWERPDVITARLVHVKGDLSRFAVVNLSRLPKVTWKICNYFVRKLYVCENVVCTLSKCTRVA